MRSLGLLPILLIAISSNADNVGVGMAYGIRRIRVPLASNLLIALVTGLATFISMLLGAAVGGRMETRMAGMLGGSIIAGLGIWVLVQSGRRGEVGAQTAAPHRPVGGIGHITKAFHTLDNPLTIDRDSSGHIDVPEACMLALALSLNNVANGVASGMVGMSAPATTVAVMIFSVLMIWAGVSAGQYGSRLLANFAHVISGVLLVAVGVYEIYV